MKKLLILSFLSLGLFLGNTSSADLAATTAVETLVCKHGQCSAAAKSTGVTVIHPKLTHEWS